MSGLTQRRNLTPVSLRFEEVFALNESWMPCASSRIWRRPRYGRPAADGREPIERKRAEHEARLEELFAKWDDVVDRVAGDDDRRQVLHALRERMLERNYIHNLLAGIERELS
jgi:predicted transcriptional regulator